MGTDKSLLKDRIFRPVAILICVLSLLFTGAGLLLNIVSESRKRDIGLQNTARLISETQPFLRDNSTAEDMNELVASLEGIDVISVIDTQNVRIYHSNNALIGTEYDGVLPSFEHSGHDGYIENSTGPSGPQRRAYSPVYDTDGEYAGFVLAIELMSNIRQEILSILAIYLLILCIILIAVMNLSRGISERIKKSLMGYEPDVFSSMYHIRDSILDSIDEGIIAVDSTGEVQFINRAAESVADTPSDSITGLLEETLKSGKRLTNRPLCINDLQIITDCFPIDENGITAGALAVMHDRTEYTKLMDDLTGAKYLVDSMRANNHDFTNKLHVVLGLIQMEMYGEAEKYIESITLVQHESISRTMNMIDDPTIAALLIGKLSRAAELNIRLTITENSRYRSSEISIPSGVLVTIIGNLIDNAFEAIDGTHVADIKAYELRVCIISCTDGLYLRVEDNGPGMDDETKRRIFEEGFSTKGRGRGCGLYQVQDLVKGFGGSISVESAPGRGSAFTVRAGEEKCIEC